MPSRSARRLGAVTAAVSALTLLLCSVGSSATAVEISAAPSTSCTSMTLAKAQARILADTNAARAAAGLAALSEHPSLDDVATAWSEHQAAASDMTHNPNYPSEIPSGWSFAAENVAAGYSVSAVTGAWMNSPGHRANILSAKATHIGIGVACNASGRAYYTQNFGGYSTPPPVIPKASELYPDARIGGVDRFSTSAAVSAATFSPGVPVVYLTNGYNFPDALSGTPAAGQSAAPVLLVTPDAIPSAIRDELTRLRPQSIVVLGSSAAVSDAVLKSARSYSSGTTTRVSGVDRYATSAAVSAATFAPGVATVYLASGANFPDALAGGAAAAHLGAPVLLVEPNALPSQVQTELARLKPGKIIVLGGATSVSDAVLSRAAKYATGGASRIAGVDRYGTAAAVSASGFSPGVDVVYLASGANFPDALSGGPAAALKNGPVLLVDPTSLPTAVRSELQRLKPKRIVILGGSPSVTDAVLIEAQRYVVN